MAIQFLNTLQFNNNQSLNFRLQVLGSDPSTSLEEGRLIYNDSGNGVVKVYTASGWQEVGGGVISLSTSNSTFVNLTDSGSATAPDLEASLSASGTANSTTFLRGDNQWATPPDNGLTSVGLSVDTTDALDVSNSPLTSNGTLDLEWQGDSSQVVLGSGELEDLPVDGVTSVGLSIDNSSALSVSAASTPVTSTGTLALEWQGTSSEYVTADGGKVSIPSSDNYNYWVLSDGSNSTNITSQATATFSGTSSEVTVSESGGTLTIGLPDDVTIGNDLFVEGEVSIEKDVEIVGGDLSIGGKATSNATVGSDSNLTLVTKGYLTSLVSGQLIYAGGYDASQDPPTGATVLQGYTYVVTVAGSGSGGTFWSVPLAIGDLIIATQDNPVDEGDWTEVNKNVTEATLTTIGEGNVNEGDAITVSYSNGTATVGVDYSANGGLIDAADSGSGTPDEDDEVLIATSSSGTGATVKYSLTDLPFTNNQGTVTSVGAIINGDAVAISDSPVTSSGDLDFEFQGAQSQYIDGTGSLRSFPTIPQGDITKVDTTSPINGGGSSGDITIGIDNASGTTVGAAAVQAGDGISVSDSNGVYTVTNSGSRGASVELNTAATGVTAQSGAPTGSIGWVIDVSNSAIGLGNDATLVKVEVIDDKAGETVYPYVVRSGSEITINMINTSITISQGDYHALLNKV